MFDSDRPASDSSTHSNTYGSSNSEMSKLKATIIFEGSAEDVRNAMFAPTREVGELHEQAKSLGQQVSELNSKVYNAEDDASRQRLWAERTEEELKDVRVNYQAVLNRECLLNDRIDNVCDERNKFYRENERLKAALQVLAGSEEAAKKVLGEIQVLQETSEPVPQTASSEPESVRRHEAPGLDPYARSVFDKMTPSTFSILLRGCAAKVDAQGRSGKIEIIRVVRSILGANLKEAKDLVEYGEIR